MTETLPLKKDAPVIFMAGKNADDIGAQLAAGRSSGRARRDDHEGTTILEGIKGAVAAEQSRVQPLRQFDRIKDKADVGIAVVGELPYAEGVGDSADLR